MIIDEEKILPMRLYGVKRFRLNHRFFGSEIEMEFFENTLMTKEEIVEILKNLPRVEKK